MKSNKIASSLELKHFIVLNILVLSAFFYVVEWEKHMG